VGPERAKLFAKLGIVTVEDLLYYLPFRYIDRSRIKKIRDLRPGETVTILAKVVGSEGRPIRRGRGLTTVVVADETGALRLKWFNQPYVESRYKPGEQLVVSGEVKWYQGREFINPEVEFLTEEDQALIHTGRIVPVYRATSGLSSRVLRSLQVKALKAYPVKEFLPGVLLSRLGLPGLPQSVQTVHFPLKEAEAQASRRRLAFDELFLLELVLALRKKRSQTIKTAVPLTGEGSLVQRLIGNLRFQLTSAQECVIKEISHDLSRSTPMNRLLQGDVGSGKTIVAAIAFLWAIESGHQAALMAPTEILATQHYFVFRDLMEPLGVRINLLTGEMKRAEKRAALDAIASGESQAVVGTHALLEQGVEFKSLALAIIDEQHRFGVLQRAALRKKGRDPHVLVMTATPIPRTLAITLYGDLDLSVIGEMPPGRHPITTRWAKEEKRPQVYEFLRREIGKGRQVYIVYPLVEESEKVDIKAATEMRERLQQDVFPDLKVGLLHGRMSVREKDDAMRRFRQGEFPILVATTVIEVGVDMPNATVMVIEHAERFGLSQIHQLRGRVGRGSQHSYCILLTPEGVSEEARARLQAIVGTTDGFKIAEQDLRQRGPGEFFGTRQHGIPELKLADLLSDTQLLYLAQREAFALVERDPSLSLPEHTSLRVTLQGNYGRKWGLIAIG
jgi:ATP-dependent DNA helicase RecG